MGLRQMANSSHGIADDPNSRQKPLRPPARLKDLLKAFQTGILHFLAKDFLKDFGPRLLNPHETFLSQRFLIPETLRRLPIPD